MKKRRMLANRLFIALILGAEALCVLIAVGFYAYNLHTITVSEKARLASLCANASSHIDSMVRSMDELSVGITIADRFIPAMRALASDEPNGDPVSAIRSIMVKAYTSKTDVYRIIVLSSNGNAVSIGRNELTKPEIQALVADGYWHETDRRGNSKVLAGPLWDPWVKRDSQQIFSLLRAVRDGDQLLGYIEVQMQTSRIADIFREKWRYDDLYYAITDAASKKVFFSNLSLEQEQTYLPIIAQNVAWYPTDSVMGDHELLSLSASNYTDWQTAMIMPKRVMYQPLRYFLPLAIAASLGLGVAIAIGFKLVINRITKPISSVVHQISSIELSSLDAPFERIQGSYEAEVLSDAFGTMKSRLSEALRQQKSIERMQNKALLEALQSRIGPHFLNNTLGSIANMCADGDTEGAANACYSLSELLRYSSHHGSDQVTVRRELTHLSDYLLLMKVRYRHRLNYTIDADDDCMDTPILKLTIQPLVENAIKYGLSEREQVTMSVTIQREASDVVIRVTDSGAGFDEPVLRQLERTMATFRADPSRFMLEESLPKRGMGLAGTLMRLSLQLGDRFCYTIQNRAEGGALIELRIGEG